MQQVVQKEIRILSDILDMPITSVSMHRPSKETLTANYSFEGAVNSYGKTFFEDFKYVSDSRRHWREDVLGIIKGGEYRRLHILTHPEWYHCTDVSAAECLKNFVLAANMERYMSLNDNIRNLSEFVMQGDVNFI